MKRYGIIDIGSNTIRLVVYETEGARVYHEIENIKVTARLRNYLEDGLLQQAGVNVLLDTLLAFQESTRFYRIQDVLCIATATIRQAKNQAYIQQLVREKTDFQLRILSEYEEAYYGYTAVVHSTPFEEGVTIDIGGGSTEITYFKDRRLQQYFSFPFGVLSLKQQFTVGNVPSAEEREELYGYVKHCFETLSWLIQREIPVIAIGGSARNMVKIHQHIIAYSISSLHLYEMNSKDIDDVQKHLSSLSFLELQKQEGLARDRSDTIILAVEVFLSLMQVTKAPSFILSRRGLREGVLYEQIAKDFYLEPYLDVVEESLQRLAEEYKIDKQYTAQLIMNATTLCEELETIGVASFSAQDKHRLKQAAKVFNIGKVIDTESSSQHTFYLLANKTIDGLMHRERIQLALLASYKSRTFKQHIASFQSWFSKEEQKRLMLLGAILQLAAALQVSGRHFVSSIIAEKQQEKDIYITVFCFHNGLAERMQAEKQKKMLEKVLKYNIKFNFLLN